ncbi:transposase [Dysgonomonas sp. ZJ709]|uniref:transposase n=1 Tax=Dysgonomonas sp. ZJ709 TaxID=2709797 RepID=UPI0013ED5EBE|nr:transposase [Dysgonomonas sp. ZJ709]
MFKDEFNSLIKLVEYFKEEKTCIEYLAVKRWGEKPCCPHCECEKVYCFSFQMVRDINVPHVVNNLCSGWYNIRITQKVVHSYLPFHDPKTFTEMCDEFVFRYNTRKLKEGERLNKMLSLYCARLTYENLIYE